MPHRIDKFLPVNAKSNKCLECHEEPDKIGKKVKGKPTPMSETPSPKSAAEEYTVSNKRYVCTLCHAPQAEVGTLMENTFRGIRPPSSSPASAPEDDRKPARAGVLRICPSLPGPLGAPGFFFQASRKGEPTRCQEG